MTAWCLGVPCLIAGRTLGDLLLQDYDEAFTSLRKAEGIGRPLGIADFVIELERRTCTGWKTPACLAHGHDTYPRFRLSY
jgi:hypothetical protein